MPGATTRRSRWAVAAAAAALVLGGCASGNSSDSAASTTSVGVTGHSAGAEEFDAIAVLGHSGATGFDSGPGGAENSWATGTNPAVDSIYLRLLAAHPALRGHNYNVAVNGSKVGDLVRQAHAAVREDPVPDLFLIQTVDNDVRCDGSDDYEAFGSTLDQALDVITQGAPRATIFIVSSPWGTEENYASVLAATPAGIAHIAGDGPCDPVDAAGALRPAAIARQQEVIDGYLAQVQERCAAHPQCRYDGGAFRNVVISAEDLSPDMNHATVAGHAKLAAAVWPMLEGI